MISKEFNAGWGDKLPLRQFEKSLCDTYLRGVAQDSVNTVLINSTWYSQEYHHEVLIELERIQPSRLIVIAMLDPAIPHLDWYDSREVWGLGYYAGAHEIDAWALIVDRYFRAEPSCSPSAIDTAFICLNRKPHWHRQKLYNDLQTADLLDRGIVTLGGSSGRPVKHLSQDVEGSILAPNPGPEQYGIVNDIMTLGPSHLWNRCFLNVVTETVFDIRSHWFVSEKIYKPVLGLRPFLVYASDGAQSWLDHVGIESYIGDFKDISDADAKDPDQLVRFLGDLAQQPVSYLRHKYLALQDKILHNKSMFDHHVRRTWQRVNQGALCQT